MSLATLFAITGAGLSAESGIPTFRGQGGLYSDADELDTLSAAGFRRNPEAVIAFCDRMRALAASAEPNAGHAAFASLEANGLRVRHFTQNVDDLLERSGATDVVHLHGSIAHARCVARSHAFVIKDGHRMPRRCDRKRCGSPMRPDVVLFDEPAPNYATLYRALRDARSTDVLIVVGTSGTILPVSEMASKFPGVTGLANLEPEAQINASQFQCVEWGPATEAVPRLLARLGPLK